MGESIHSNENNIEYVGSEIERNNLSYLKTFLTKQMCKILLILFFQTLSNKELAKRMGITTNALSNILQRMKASQVELFVISKKEKFTLYSLTLTAQAYVKEYLIPEEDSGLKIIPFSDDETSNYMECSDALHKWKHSLQIDSETEFSKFMELHYVKESKEKRRIYDDCIRHLVKMEDGKQTGRVHKIVEELGEPLLERNVLHCVSLYNSMIKLCKIYDISWELSYDLVDSFIDSKGENVGLDLLMKCKESRPEDIAEMGQNLWGIVNISGMNNLSMDEFMECWKAYFSEKQFLRFIASRYDSWMAKR